MEHKRSPVHLLPSGIVEETLVAGKVSRIGFKLPADSTITIPFTVPADARRLLLSFCFPGEHNKGKVTFRAVLLRSNGERVELVERVANAGPWTEETAQIAAFAGEALEIVLSCDRSEGAPEETVVYWGTPIVLRHPQQKPNILLISIDSLRADHLGCYGYSRQTSPSLDSLAATGFVFTRAVAQSQWTLPSHVSLLTSLYARSHGVRTAKDGLSYELLTLAEELRDAGYITAAFLSGPFLLPRYGMHQGFDLYDARCSNIFHEGSHCDITNPCIHSRTVEWLRQCGENPFFLFLHYWDVHYDYIPPAPFDTLFDPDYRGDIDGKDIINNKSILPGMAQRDLDHIVALYDGEIAYTDKHIGMLLRELRQLGLGEKTLVIVTSDHGEEFLEHGGKGHLQSLFQELIHVPIIWAGPGQLREPLIVDDLVETIDLAPSVLEFLGLEVPASMEGKSLPLFSKAQTHEERVALSETESGRHARTILTGNTKLVVSRHTGQTEAYDLQRDPRELAPTAPESLLEPTQLRRALSALLEDEKVIVDIRVVGAERPGNFSVSLSMSQPFLEVRPWGLEHDDTLDTSLDPPWVTLKTSSPHCDVDGLTLVLPSSETCIRLNGDYQSLIMLPMNFVLGAGMHPEEVPFEITAGNRCLKGPSSGVPRLEKEGPVIHIWKTDNRAPAAMRVEMDDALRARLSVLGYMQ